MTRRSAQALVLVWALVLTSCISAASETTITSTTIPEETLFAESLEEVRPGVVRIETEGTFEYPAGTSSNEAGSGSGFFISEDGFIVTNNHVVAGAGRVQVYLDGASNPLNGRVIGTSECADLAVVDVDVTEQPYLKWSEGSISTGQEIFVAGFPLGDPEYTLVDGIVSKEKASGDSDWASIDSVIEHSADTLPGSSGGPIVSADGTVVGVNYAGDDFGQAFGISAQVARGVVADILSDRPTLSIGINGWAHEDEFGTGIWVASVIADSPADRAGIRAGDLITQLARLDVAEDLTLASYCDTLDSHSPDLPFDVEVWRAKSSAYFDGVINSDQVLEISDRARRGFTAIDDLAVLDLPIGIRYEEYDVVVDETGTFTFEVPAAWADRRNEDWAPYGAPTGPGLAASSDLAAWDEYWGTPGVFVGISKTLLYALVTPRVFLSEFEMDGCEFATEVPYDDGQYMGYYDVFVNCGDTGNWFVMWAATNISIDTLINGQFTITSLADIEAMARILGSFYLTRELPD